MKLLSSHKWTKRITIVIGYALAVIIIFKIYDGYSLSIAHLPDFDRSAIDEYRVKPYIAAAMKLQAMGQNKAEQYMMKYAQKNRYGGDQLYVLCRMLYTKSPTSDFDWPPLGRPSCFGGTTYLDWPLTPIEIVDGVPFLIADGHAIYGALELPSTYLNYCMTNCEWNTFSYRKNSRMELSAALNKLLTSVKWKQPLSPEEKEWLTVQIR